MLDLLSCSPLLFFLTLTLTFCTQSSMCMLRHYNVSQSELGGLHAKVAEVEKTLKDALYTADVVSKDQDKKINELKETVKNLNETTEKEQEKAAAQERKNELLQAKVTMLEENLATE